MPSSSLFALVVFAVAATAIPYLSPLGTTIPTGATHIAFDREHNLFHAFHNDEELGSYPASSQDSDIHRRQNPGSTCGLMQQDEQSFMAGWQSMVDSATSAWGSDYVIHVNPAQWPQHSAIVCVSESPQIAFSSSPNCTTTKQTSQGTVVGTNGTYSISYSEGTTGSTSLTVTAASPIGAGISVSAQFSLPSILDLNPQVSYTAQVDNTPATGTSFPINTTTIGQKLSVATPDNESCTLTFSETSCTAEGAATIPLTASGWIWFYYPSRRNGHYEWAISIEQTIIDASQRTSTMAVTATTQGATTFDFNAHC